VRFSLGDVRDREALTVAATEADPDIIYHLAAETGTGQSFDLPSRYCAVNVDGACHLIEALRGLPNRKRRFILAGSRAVYGEGAYRTPDGDVVVPGPRRVEAMQAGEFEPLDGEGRPLAPAATGETTPPQPASIYASTKLMQEYVCRQALQGSMTDLVVLRFQNVYGPGQSLANRYTGVLSIFAAQILEGRALELYEDGRITRDFVFVDDVVESLRLAGLAPFPGDAPINIGSGKPCTIEEAAQILLRALGADPSRCWVSGRFRAGDVRHAVADVTRARQVLGWSPRVPLETGLAALARWAAREPATQSRQEELAPS
jgi:dTDP-L-rhamnose 4-epimerase